MLKEVLLRLGDSEAVETVVRKTPLSVISRRFVPGESIESLLAAVREARRHGLDVTVNYLGEAEHDRATANAATEVYLSVIERVAREGLPAGISVKLSQLGQEIGEEPLLENLDRILERGRRNDVFVRLDMESSRHTDATLRVFERVRARGFRGVGVVLQAALHRTPDDVRRMNALGASVRLCKGAYREPPSIAFQDPETIRESFVRCMKLLLAEGRDPAIATHDERLIRATIDFARRRGIPPERFEFQMLHGVRRDLQRQLVSGRWRVRVYIPFGRSWYPYLMRRLAERPANVLLLAGSLVRESPLGFLWPDGGGGNHTEGET